MDEATKAKLKELGLESVITAFTALETKATDVAKELDTAKATIAEKDRIITEKTEQVVGARKEYKKLADMTEAEKEAMSAKEIELQERQEAHEESVAQFQKEQADSLKKEVDARKERAIAKIAGKDPELAQKIRDNYSRILDNDKAQTEEEVAKIVTESFNMTGAPKPDAMRAAIQGSGQGEAGGTGDGTNFAETKEGQELSAALGLPAAPADGGGAAA